MTREALLTQTMVEVADSLVDDFDIMDLLYLVTERCVEIVDVDTAGIMLCGSDGSLRPMAASSEAMRLLELFEVQADEGPCFDSYHRKAPVSSPDLATDARWPSFGPRALDAGFHAVTALPMKLRGTVVGALNLFNTDAGAMSATDLTAVQALADIATISLMQHRIALEAQLLNEQLQAALNSRVVIEQAKGMVAERFQLDMEQSFIRLRTHARSNRLRLTDVAGRLTRGELHIDEV